jgi:hypothetical protein
VEAKPKRSLAEAERKSEEGLIEGRRLNLVRRIYAAIDIALAQYSYDNLAQLSRDISKVAEQSAKRRALGQRMKESAESIERLAANQQWGQLQRSLRHYKALLAQYRAMQDE